MRSCAGGTREPFQLIRFCCRVIRVLSWVIQVLLSQPTATAQFKPTQPPRHSWLAGWFPEPCAAEAGVLAANSKKKEVSQNVPSLTPIE